MDSIVVIYEKKKYVFSPGSGWVDDQNIAVPEILETFLSRKAVAEGTDASIFGGIEALDEQAKVTRVQKKAKKPKKTMKKFSISLGGD